jgi:hypothetical protein
MRAAPFTSAPATENRRPVPVPLPPATTVFAVAADNTSS